jgi:hypothetical protein
MKTERKRKKEKKKKTCFSGKPAGNLRNPSWFAHLIESFALPRMNGIYPEVNETQTSKAKIERLRIACGTKRDCPEYPPPKP